MESGIKIFVDDEGGVVEKPHGEGAIQSETDSSEILVKAIEEKLNSSEAAVKENKISKKGSSGGGLKSTKVVKDQPKRKGLTPLANNTRRSLTQSPSFPTKGPRPDVMKKSIDVYPSKVDAKSTRANGAKRDSGLNLKENGGGGEPRRRTPAASSPSTQRLMSGKSDSVNGAANGASADVSLSVDQTPKPIITASAVKEEEDAQSTTSSTATPSGQRRSTSSGFSFRLEERLEKRKEYFTKLEERKHEREVERSNMLEKTKEKKEAEIRQFRKSLTFKATPMPNFYKEPPPKAELKKIPVTRALSPKLGRNKSSVSATVNSSESVESSLSPRVSQVLKSPRAARSTNENNAAVASPKKTTRKSLSKLHPQQNVASKEAETKPVKSQDQKEASAGESAEIQKKPENVDEVEENVSAEPDTNGPDIPRAEVTLEG